MATFSKIPLSGSTNGRGVLVTQTATPGTTIHTAVSGTSSFDEVWLYSMNTSGSSVKLTVEYGGTGVGDIVEITLASESGLVLVVPGLMLNDAAVVRAFAGTGSVISLYGYVNRVA